MWEMGEGGRVPPVAHYPEWIEQSSSRGAMIKSLAPTIYERRLVALRRRREDLQRKKKRGSMTTYYCHYQRSSQNRKQGDFSPQCDGWRDPLRGVLLNIAQSITVWNLRNFTLTRKNFVKTAFTVIEYSMEWFYGNFAKNGESKIPQFSHLD